MRTESESCPEIGDPAHYIVNASASGPARIVVAMVTPKAAPALTEPLT